MKDKFQLAIVDLPYGCIQLLRSHLGGGGGDEERVVQQNANVCKLEGGGSVSANVHL